MTLREFDSHEILGNEQDTDMRAYINQLVNELREDTPVYEKLKELHLTMKDVRDNIAKLNDFREDYHYCLKCPGITACAKKTPHISMRVEKEDGFVKVQYEPCHKIVDQIRRDSRYMIHDFPDQWKLSSLKDMDLTENRRPIIKEFSKIIKGQSNRWLYLIGNHKVGKSHLLVTMANEFIAIKNEQVAVMSCVERIKQLADLSSKEPEIFANEISLFGEVPLLILDGFGEEYKNEYIRDSIVIPILAERERQNLPTWFTSPFTFDEIQQLYSVGKTSGTIRGKQLGNILREMCEEEFDLTGTSYKK